MIKTIIGRIILALLIGGAGLAPEGRPSIGLPDCGDRAPLCATTDDGPQRDGWYLILPGDVSLPVPPPGRSYTDRTGVTWHLWGRVTG